MVSEQRHSNKRKHLSSKQEVPEATNVAEAKNETTIVADVNQGRRRKRKHREPKENDKDDDDDDVEVPQCAENTAFPSIITTDHDKRSTRFIAFIGNLPYTATKAAVEKHFASVEPTAVRLMTMKDDPSRCKGFAFVEFARYDKMELCLTKFHHSIFNDGISDARKINVELTAGGGGKSKTRKQKLRTKNEKLNEERKRSAADRAKDKVERIENAEDGMHPSRRRRLR
ncbi:hypothetical protein FN846DRAFT_892336 [Sphaerosporella brunnea]|uniref:RRM domain-containing protein n=1 Tax=Sphaerosporella brunnea TaxID=1250544 RepID=A0A5J5EPL0_9PEZI|nr:hypothetical protein FN846DRAFT_892336 [Sphaerosporella brunnea]